MRKCDLQLLPVELITRIAAGHTSQFRWLNGHRLGVYRCGAKG
jgi:hypothetical protein